MEISHPAQIGILRQLLFHPASKFSQLNTTGLDNNHFNFHLQQLLSSRLIEKAENRYQLTPAGLTLANKLDSQSDEFLLQPKLGVLIFISTTINNRKMVLLGKRLKNPNIGLTGFYAGKVRVNESIFAAASRCLQEETGLTAEFKYCGTVRILDPANDRLMIYLKSSSLSSTNPTQTNRSSNQWYSPNDLPQMTNTFPDFQQDLLLFNQKQKFFQERPLPSSQK